MNPAHERIKPRIYRKAAEAAKDLWENTKKSRDIPFFMGSF